MPMPHTLPFAANDRASVVKFVFAGLWIEQIVCQLLDAGRVAYRRHWSEKRVWRGHRKKERERLH